MPTENDDARTRVREGYAAIAEGKGRSCSGPSKSCCGASDENSLAQAIGYVEADLTSLPDGANMGLSCGNPLALATLAKGETVVDLGAGGGFDIFIAGPRVGAEGRAIGVDMTPEMLSKARANITVYRERTGFDNVEFRLGEIEHLPVADNTVDVIISNCVINLSPDKPQVWREIARVLKPGGRAAISDLALLKPLPEAVATMVEALVGCIAGAVLVEDTERMAREAGLEDIQLTPKHEYIDSLPEWQDPMYKKIISTLPDGAKLSDYVVSLEVTAHKPAPACCRG